MIKFTELYATGEDQSFDMDYYLHKHVPMIQHLAGAALKQVTVDQGISGVAPGTDPPFLAMGHFYFESTEELQATLRPHIERILADVPNFTCRPPEILISQVVR